MNPIDDRTPVFPPSLSAMKIDELLRFLEHLSVALEQLNEQAPGGKNSSSVLYPPLLSLCKVNYLMLSGKTNPKTEQSSERTEAKEDPENFLHQAAKKLEVVSHITLLGKSESKAEIPISSKAGTETLQPPPMPTSEPRKQGNIKKPALPPTTETLATLKPTAQDNSPRFATKHLLATLVAILEKPASSQFMQAIKPLLKHLIVVVETQENMSGFSKKILQLSKGLLQETSLVPKLDMISLLKIAAAPRKESTTPLKEKEAFVENVPYETRPLPNLSLPSFLKREGQISLKPGPSNTPPVIMPYTGEKPKTIHPKKKKKDPNPDKEDEEEKDR
ncbi:MAG: hypothetical protein Q8L98_00325 [Chlamydiales bacterium]|nr:hypothetical protein [Chlamydiales bacterium]